MRSGAIKLLSLAAIILVGGCESPETEYERARVADTVDDYTTFIAKYPTHPATREAEYRISEILWDTVKHTDRVSVITEYLKEHPTSPYYEDALELGEQLTFTHAVESKSLDSIVRYLKSNPNSKYKYAAIAKTIELEALRPYIGSTEASVYISSLTRKRLVTGNTWGLGAIDPMTLAFAFGPDSKGKDFFLNCRAAYSYGEVHFYNSDTGFTVAHNARNNLIKPVIIGPESIYNDVEFSSTKTVPLWRIAALASTLDSIEKTHGLLNEGADADTIRGRMRNHIESLDFHSELSRLIDRLAASDDSALSAIGDEFSEIVVAIETGMTRGS